MKGISATPTFEGFIALSQHLATNIQQQHWKTRSYAAHVTLGDFYEALTGHIDTLVEAKQGRDGLLDIPEVPFRREQDPVMAIRTTRRYLDENRIALCPYAEIQNLFDELLATMDKALYKLEQLS